LLMQRHLHLPQDEEDAYSTTSEMGTVIDNERMNDLEETPRQDLDHYTDIQGNSNATSREDDDDSLLKFTDENRMREISLMKGSGKVEEYSPTESESSPSTPPQQYSDPVWDEEALSLPLLQSSKSGLEEEKKLNDDEDDNQRSPVEPPHHKSRRAWPVSLSSLSSSRMTRSAPATPRQTHSDEKVYVQPSHHPHTHKHFLSPRFQTSSLSTANHKHSDRNYSSNAFFIARSCFSYDHYDTCMDDKYEYQVPFPQTVHRSRPSRSSTIRVLQSSQSWDGSRLSSHVAAATQSHMTPRRAAVSRRRERAHSDMDQWNGPTLALQTPQRVDLEREDALDILMCLVERGVSLQDWKISNQKTGKSEDSQAVKPLEIHDDIISSLGSFDIDGAINELKQLSTAAGENENAHQIRMTALEVLSRSHEYALDMKRASQSASSWLQSIGRPPSVSRSEKDRSTDPSPLKDPELMNEIIQPQLNDSAEMDVLTLKAMLHTAQKELQDKTALASRLNDDLAKCRAEIGRLQCLSHSATSIRTPNRSILDESDEAEDEASDALSRKIMNTSTIEEEEEEDDPDKKYNQIMNTSFLDTLDTPLIREEQHELAKYKAALEKANRQIQKLHADLCKTGEVETDEAPVIAVEEVLRARESPGNKEERTVNVRMLDGENFVTDWNALTPPLPPPPDHELDSPIVSAVLEQWTDDNRLHESLITWIDEILNGGDVDSIPPLTISNVDHQVRDGMAMHILPLLLRRRDIRVDVHTRAHRRTTYDLSVTVDRLAPAPATPIDIRRHLENVSARSDVGTPSVSHSATTAFMTNTTRGWSVDPPRQYPYEHEGTATRISYDEFSEGITNSPQPGLMSALGDALGGFLIRRKPPTPVSHSGSGFGSSGNVDSMTHAHSAERGVFATIDEATEKAEDQPYHRVVSAPPGRIGVTFVEFRGHAMVSEVADDSPLAGWIFPSDILIAIDELPVSGMRVRDIIKVLKDRKDRQRALRVISCHAMNEFTLNNSVNTDNP
jgi:hypothetical protein